MAGNTIQAIHIPKVNELLECTLLAVQDIHHVEILLIQPRAAHPKIRKEWLRGLGRG